MEKIAYGEIYLENLLLVPVLVNQDPGVGKLVFGRQRVHVWTRECEYGTFVLDTAAAAW